MTTAEALAIAAQAKPTHRQPLDKLQGSTTAGDFTARAEALRKSHDGIGNDIAGMTVQLSKIAEDVEFLQNFSPSSPIRRMQS